ncbi:glycosyltransferase family 39 protein [Nostoc sp. FACHB-152]|uniref:ArnT family glycosyltransferase n=1 Tax=unclassified Nostoc TaxID=2593658 RepID=UPI00168A0F27|nr:MULTISPECIES: glycosyltransferase family 39 protein [unclassified Nostoc]MBD2451522.1 glycosyltransferase family 39 protein [Nostoc sp. FACHB-152]MBD2468614.1 glycosyltransferase family 39 protein [Nostoc sp. FACHB-145]
MFAFRDKEWLLLLLISSLVIWLVFLGNLPLRDWDEGTVAQVAREIWRAPSGSWHWLYPTLGGEAYLNKPPLMHLLIAWAYSLGGVSEWTTRLPGAIFTALGVPLLYLVGRLVFDQSLPALFAALVYLTMLPVVRHGRLAMLDGASITFFILLLFCLLKARHNYRWTLGVGISLGLITLTKGMLVLLLGGIAGLFLLASKQSVLLKSPYLWVGIFVGITPAIAWYLAQWQHYGSNFLQVNLQAQTFARLGQSVEGNAGPPWYYLIELLKYSFPWLLFWPGGFYLAWKQRQTSWGSLVLIGTTIYLGTISLMTTKLPWYIMPVYPFLALAIGAKLHEVWQKTDFKARIWGYLIFVIAIAGLGGCVYFAIGDYQPVLIAMSIVLVITMSIGGWLILAGDRRFIPVLFVGMYLVLLLLMSSQSWIWELNENFAVKPVAALIRTHLPPGTKIYTSFAYSRPSLDFYCDCKVISANTQVLEQMWSNKSYLLLDNSNLDKMNLSRNQVIGTSEGFTLIAPTSN